MFAMPFVSRELYRNVRSKVISLLYSSIGSSLLDVSHKNYNAGFVFVYDSFSSIVEPGRRLSLVIIFVNLCPGPWVYGCVRKKNQYSYTVSGVSKKFNTVKSGHYFCQSMSSWIMSLCVCLEKIFLTQARKNVKSGHYFCQAKKISYKYVTKIHTGHRRGGF